MGYRSNGIQVSFSDQHASRSLNVSPCAASCVICSDKAGAGPCNFRVSAQSPAVLQSVAMNLGQDAAGGLAKPSPRVILPGVASRARSDRAVRFVPLTSNFSQWDQGGCHNDRGRKGKSSTYCYQGIYVGYRSNPSVISNDRYVS